MFCCNCAGGCRKAPDFSKKHKRWEPEEEHSFDKNNDGFYDIEEAHERLRSGSCGNYTEKIARFAGEFDRMDKNKDGMLSYEEIDS